jgi:two-component system LytT family sensor kinase
MNFFLTKKGILFNYLWWVSIILILVTLPRTLLIRTNEQTYLNDISFVVECLVESGVALLLSTLSIYLFDEKFNVFKVTFKNILFVLFLILICTFIWAESWERIANFISQLIASVDNWDEKSFSNVNYRIYNFLWKSMIFALWFIIYLFIKVIDNLKNEKIERVEIEKNLKESQLNTLKGQINPHFMFNSLNNIRGLILENPAKSREMITRLSEMLRYSLTKSEVNTIALEEEIEMVENFIAISKIQLEDRLQFVSDIDEDSKRLQIPPMIIQMLIENAVKHGISQLKEGGVVHLNIKRENSVLHIEVNNTGLLSQEVSTTQVGLKNIQRRLRLLYGEIATFELYEIENEVIAKILIPIS